MHIGPSFEIVFREAFAALDTQDLEIYLKSFVSEFVRVDPGNFEFRIKNGQPVGLDKDCAASSSLGLHLLLDQDYSDSSILDQRAQCLLHLGFVPRQRLSLFAGGKKEIDHEVIGRLGLSLAERYGGFLCLGNLWWIIPRDIEVSFTAFLGPMPGRLFDRGDNHVADTTWFHAWLEHPNFRLNK